MRAASAFDFGLILFEPDDVVQSRDNAAFVPRDNVVFELRLFVNHLRLQTRLPESA